MGDVLENDIMESLNSIQTKIIDVVDEYKIDNNVEVSCVRCSGSAGRYVYEKNQTEKRNNAIFTIIMHNS
jgi:hypothetical protein